MNNQNSLDTPDMIPMILSNVPGFLQARCNRHVHKIRKIQTKSREVVVTRWICTYALFDRRGQGTSILNQLRSSYP